MSRLIVLSNRVKMPDNNPMAGGLAIALQDVLMEKSVIWMGWNGEVSDSIHDDFVHEFSSTKQSVSPDMDISQGNTSITYMTTAFTTQQYQQFYCGYANNGLWPLLHERVDLMSQAPEDYTGYQAVNRLFAEQLRKVVEPHDVIWVHDYHFLSVAYHCRRLGICNRIGLFLHIPFVSLPFWQSLDNSSELIGHLAHYDVVGTQTQQGRVNCLAVCRHYLKDKLSEAGFLTSSPINILHEKQHAASSQSSSAVRLMFDLELKPQHALMIKAYPIGVNVERIQQQVSHLSAHGSLQAANPNLYKNTKKSAAQQIIAVDRIDYSKGLLRRFSAYRDFLQQNPSYQNQLKLLQIACPSRLDVPTYQQLYNEVKTAVHDINQQFLPSNDTKDASIEDWQVINYCESVISHKALMAMFWQSDIGWVNSLKDGMNLVAKEYIAAQNPDNPGVLLLSRYAGAAEQMQAAVIIDPHQPSSMAEGLSSALTMPLDERRSRHQSLLQGLQQDNLQAWQQGFLDDLYDDKSCLTDGLRPATVYLSDS